MRPDADPIPLPALRKLALASEGGASAPCQRAVSTPGHARLLPRTLLAGMPLRASTLVALACILGGGGSTRPAMEFDPPIPCRITAPRTSAFFLIADAGKPVLPSPDAADPNALIDPVLSALAGDVRETLGQLGPDRTAVIVLGDNVYPAGMPPPGEKGHDLAARILDARIAAIGEARGFFTLGDHDWLQGRRRGWANAKAQVDSLSSKTPNI